MIPVEGHKNLFRDPETGAIVSTATTGNSNYIYKRNNNSTYIIDYLCFIYYQILLA